MSVEDPIWRALATGDEHCPDGAALARLGQRMREAARPPRPVDLRERVRAALGQDGDAAEEDLVAAHYGGDGAAGAADPGLVRLGELMREAARPPRPVDLLPDVSRSLQEERRVRRSSARLQVDTSTRWRIWTAVIGGHVAALLAVLVLVEHFRPQIPDQAETDRQRMAAYVRFYNADLRRMGVDLEPDLARSWNDLSEHPLMLFGLRIDDELRRQAIDHFGMAHSQGTVLAGLTWLVHQQGPDGSWVRAADARRQQAVNAAAILALMADGARTEERLQALRRGLDWLRRQDPRPLLVDDAGHAARPACGLVALALAEGGLLLEDPQLSEDAAELIASGVHALPEPGTDGFFALAVATARLTGMVDATTLAAMRDQAARPDADPGLAAVLARLSGSEPQAVAPLMALLPEPDATDRVDPLSWFMPGIALREVGGRAWSTWAQALQRSMLLAFDYDGDEAWLPASAVQQATGPGADVFATSLALLNLQLAYRYLPMAPVLPDADGLPHGAAADPP